MGKSKTRVLLQAVNIVLIIFSVIVLWYMRLHNYVHVEMINSELWDDGFIFGYLFFFNPLIKWVYILVMLIVIGKEFIIKRPLEFKVKLNLALSILFPLLFLFQFYIVPKYLERVF